MQNPFKRKPETFLESIKHHLIHKQTSKYTTKNIALAVGVLFVTVGWISWISGKQSHSEKPLLSDAVIRVSGEVSSSGVIVEEVPGLKPGEICMRRPDIFIFHYRLDNELKDQTQVQLQMAELKSLSERGAIVLMAENIFRKSLQRKCFGGNPIWILSAESEGAKKTLSSIGTENNIPLFEGSGIIDPNTLSGYTVEHMNIDNFTPPRFFREKLQKYFELESGGFLKNID